MSYYSIIYKAITQFAWGYLFLFVNFYIFKINIFPDFIGYILILCAINVFKEVEKELELIHHMCIFLIIFSCIDSFMTWRGTPVFGMFKSLSVIYTVIFLYFNFQLLTNIASVAKKFQRSGNLLDERILMLRTIQTILLTGIEILRLIYPWITKGYMVISIVSGIGCAVAGLCLLVTMFQLRNRISLCECTE